MDSQFVGKFTQILNSSFVCGGGVDVWTNYVKLSVDRELSAVST